MSVLKGKAVEEALRRAAEAGAAEEADQITPDLQIPTLAAKDITKAGPTGLNVPGPAKPREAVARAQRNGATGAAAKAIAAIDNSRLESEKRRLTKLKRELGVLADLLTHDDVSDIHRNPDGRLWVKRVGSPVAEIEYIMSDDTAYSLIGTISEFMKNPVSDKQPLLEGVLPHDKSRFSALLPPVSNGGPMFSIRKRAVLKRTFDNYIDDLSMTSDQAAFIRKRIRARDNFLIVGGTGSGKALPLDAQILTPAGYVAMRDLRIGDRVIGRNGRATRITGVFPQGKKSAWRLTFSDGCTTIACDEHLWAVQTKSGRSAGRDFVVKSVKEIRTDLTYSDGKPKWFIPMVEPIHLKKRAVGLDPYVLGFLLGRRRLTGSVPIRKEGEAALLPTSDQPLSYAAALRKLGLLNQDLSTVCIPDTYKWNDLATRLALFQGLMDGGAWFQAGNNHISFSCASRDLAEDVIWLVQSFGGVARLNERDGRMYRIYIRLPESIVPSRAPWTLERYRPCTYRPPARSIVSIERVKPVPMQCIAVDAPDALYVIEHCVVTHNTTLGNAILKEMSEAASADERFIILEDTAELQCFAPQTVMLLTSPQMTMNDLLKAIMRHSPTRICVGELRGGEAHTLIKAWNTGHNGGLTTIHAENAHRALDRLEDLVLEAGIQPSRRKIADSVNCIIVINADSRGHRTVKEIVRVSAVGNDYILSTK